MKALKKKALKALTLYLRCAHFAFDRGKQEQGSKRLFPKYMYTGEHRTVIGPLWCYNGLVHLVGAHWQN